MIAPIVKNTDLFYVNPKYLNMIFFLFSCLQHKMFYKTKSTSRRTSGSPTVTAPNDGLSELRDPRRSTNLIGLLKLMLFFLFRFRLFFSMFSFLGSQQFYIYSIDGRTNGNAPNVHLDLPPKYEDVIKDPNYVRREVA